MAARDLSHCRAQCVCCSVRIVSFRQAELVSFANACDPGDRHHVVRLLDCFAHAAGGGRFHRVLVFEKLARTLYDLLRDTGFLGVSLPLARVLGGQLLDALAFLGRPDVAITHADVKPLTQCSAPSMA